MDDAASVCMRETRGDAGGDGERLVVRERLLVAKPLLQRAAGHVLEHHVRPPLRLAVVVELGDVRMGERRDRARLAFEPGGVRVRGEQLDRDVAAELEILGAPDLGHPAAPEHVIEPVAACNHGVGHADTLCADRGRLTHPGPGAGARARPCARLASEAVSVQQAAGRVTAEPAQALVDLPPFPSSAMDGFAVRAADLPGTLPVVEHIAAGRPAERALEPGEAMAISTGGVVPDGADSVIPLEYVVQHDNRDRS